MAGKSRRATTAASTKASKSIRDNASNSVNEASNSIAANDAQNESKVSESQEGQQAHNESGNELKVSENVFESQVRDDHNSEFESSDSSMEEARESKKRVEKNNGSKKEVDRNNGGRNRDNNEDMSLEQTNARLTDEVQRLKTELGNIQKFIQGMMASQNKQTNNLMQQPAQVISPYVDMAELKKAEEQLPSVKLFLSVREWKAMIVERLREKAKWRVRFDAAAIKAYLKEVRENLPSAISNKLNELLTSAKGSSIICSKISKI